MVCERERSLSLILLSLILLSFILIIRLVTQQAWLEYRAASGAPRGENASVRPATAFQAPHVNVARYDLPPPAPLHRTSHAHSLARGHGSTTWYICRSVRILDPTCHAHSHARPHDPTSHARSRQPYSIEPARSLAHPSAVVCHRMGHLQVSHPSLCQCGGWSRPVRAACDPLPVFATSESLPVSTAPHAL